MSRIIDLSNADKGFQLASTVLAALQDEGRDVITGISTRYGEFAVLQGCQDGDLDSTFDAGLVVYQGALHVFEGGVFNNFIVTDTVTTQLVNQVDNVARDHFTIKTLKFAAAIPGGEIGFAVTEDAINGLVNELNYFDFTHYELETQVETNITDIATNAANIGDCITTTVNVTNIDAVENLLFEVGDVRYVKSIANFTAGLGDAGTARQNWVLVGDHVNIATWRTALGVDVATTFADIERRALAIAGTLPQGSMVGANTVELTKQQLPSHNHSIIGALAQSGGAHVHRIAVGGDNQGANNYLAKIDNSNNLEYYTDLAGEHNHTVVGVTYDEAKTPLPVSIQNKILGMYLIVKYK